MTIERQKSGEQYSDVGVAARGVAQIGMNQLQMLFYTCTLDAIELASVGRMLACNQNTPSLGATRPSETGCS